MSKPSIPVELQLIMAAYARCEARERDEPLIVKGNPLAVWSLLFANLAVTPQDQPIALSPGARAYLEQVAWRLKMLQDGTDYSRVAKARVSQEGGVVLVGPTLTPRQCAERVPAALGLVAPRSSRFSERRREQRARFAEFARELVLLNGGSRKEARAAALAEIGKKAGHAGEPQDAARTLRKVLARGRRKIGI